MARRESIRTRGDIFPRFDPTPCSTCGRRLARPSTFSGNEVTFNHRAPASCGITRRPLTPQEQRGHKAYSKESGRRGDLLHRLWHDFLKQFKEKDDHGYGDWKYQGCDLMDEIAKWAEQHPEVVITGCDDTYFSSSDIVLIPHENAWYYMGTTVLIVTQCDGLPPKEFFLYPEHVHGLQQALKTIAKRGRAKAKEW